MANFVDPDKQVPPVPDAEQPQDENISADQMASTIVVTGLPAGERAPTLAAMQEALASVEAGESMQTILQDDGHQQHAVVILASPQHAEAALALNGVPILGNPVGVVLAAALQQPAEEPDSTPSQPQAEVVAVEQPAQGTSSSSLFARAKAGIAKTAAAIGVKAVEVDQRSGISSTISAAALATRAKALQVNEEYKISERVKSAAGAVDQRIRAIDEQYKLQERANAAAATATQTATNLANEALKNEKVKAGWGFTKRLAAKAASAASAAVASATAEASDVRNQTVQEYQRRRASSSAAGENKQ